MTNMTRRYGRAPCHERLVCKTPHGHWKTSTFIAGLRHDGITSPFLIEGPMDGEAFRAYVTKILAPALNEGDIVVMDNLRTHKVEGIRRAIEAKGATLLYLPPYSPDFNPIEQAFSKLKAFLRKVAERTIDTLWNAVGSFLPLFRTEECRNYFTNSGYEPS